ncbi:polyubiquitin-tagged protein recognition complex Npl4 component [Russula earlei]|uniref:Polyubiquitin-tagged protein recognition complex Npl4 component n=1 Tax=Russula earlei TaxID=71964 RepID=A0ACC0UL42_9AGAM|nr:polyubiquitin-tagged protein recognition complex Npl4 component [Russula earlei]
MLVRIRSKDGNFRFEFQPTSDISELVTKILETTENADPATLAISNQPRGNETLVSTLRGRNLKSLGIRHGELVFVSYSQRSTSGTSQDRAPEKPFTSGVSTSSPNRPWENVKEDAIDQYWRTKDGKISRSRDANFCKHGANAMCDYCMPLEPYDRKYHQDHNIKHLSYHAFLRQLTPKPDYRIKVPCPTGGHANWPAGICTACQPSAITLQSQSFRMVDHLEIASTEIIDGFLKAWRSTGLQRFGWLIGRYEPYDKVPMGVKAVVEAIHEPPQEGELDGLSLELPWTDDSRVRTLAAAASTPLTIVGYIFTDLDPTAEDRTKNIYKRHPGSFFLSSLEVLFAAHLQAQQPTPSCSSPSGKFASRLVTAVLTGTEDGAVDIAAYQVSEQAVGMLQADMIEASIDPGVMRVKEESRGDDGGTARYVPDVFFRYRNEYGIEVKKSAKPAFPVEYLLVNVTHGFPQNPSPVLRSHNFAIENRPGLEEQSIEQVMRSLNELGALDVQPSQRGPSRSRGGVDDDDRHSRLELANWLRDWHLVAFLGTCGLFSEHDAKVLIRVATAPNIEEDPTVLDSLLETESWQTLTTFTRESAPPPRPTQPAPDGPTSRILDDDIPPELFDNVASPVRDTASGSAGGRVCPHCTFENPHGGNDCEVCGLPL